MAGLVATRNGSGQTDCNRVRFRIQIRESSNFEEVNSVIAMMSEVTIKCLLYRIVLATLASSEKLF